MEKYTFAIHTLGCRVNTYESDLMALSLKEAGFTEKAFTEKADVYIINTCTVTNIADRKSRQMLRRARGLNPQALIAAAGCYVDDALKNGSLGPLMAEGVIDLAIPNREKQNAASLIIKELMASRSPVYAKDGKEQPLNEGTACLKAPALSKKEEGASPAGGFLTSLSGHTRAFIKVQDGCDMFCSYCVIPYVRGRAVSRPNEDTLAEIRELAKKGTAEVVITGIHLTSMGKKLIRLLEEIDRIDGIERIRLGSLEPTFINESTAESLRSIGKLCPHFHLSLQSGSDRVLKAMNRHYKTADYEKSCRILREYFGRPAITTDIIAGFPGETEEMFGETLDFVRRIGFYEAHVFKYSRRKGTAADNFTGQLTEAVKQERSQRLIALCRELSNGFRRGMMGKAAQFLSEELITIDGELYETGYTPEYVRAVKRTDTLHLNSLVGGVCSHIIQQNGMDARLLLE